MQKMSSLTPRLVFPQPNRSWLVTGTQDHRNRNAKITEFQQNFQGYCLTGTVAACFVLWIWAPFLFLATLGGGGADCLPYTLLMCLAVTKLNMMLKKASLQAQPLVPAQPDTQNRSCPAQSESTTVRCWLQDQRAISKRHCARDISLGSVGICRLRHVGKRCSTFSKTFCNTRGNCGHSCGFITPGGVLPPAAPPAVWPGPKHGLLLLPPQDI